MKFTSILTEIFFPRTCLGCGINIKNGVICGACFTGIPINTAFFCGECGARLPIALKICHPKVPCLMGAAGPYNNPALKALIHNLKFRNAREAAEPLAELMVKFLEGTAERKRRPSSTTNAPRACRGSDGVFLEKTVFVSGFTIIPIPLSKQRQLERGYNQANLIAAKLTERISLPIVTDVLLKTKHTKPQTETKDIKERRENLSGCFTVKNPEAVKGKKILLIDDVTTSGSTFLEAARALKAAGARRIIAVAAAKA